ncbi:MAG TPA: VTT domain-containing protein [Anaerolineae bacterium]|nr:VTT domain-containing protein [Anaerolineae bacterium]
MDSIEAFLNTYGLLAIFGLMLVKGIGVPIPVPADVIMLATAARAAEGRLVLWQAFAAILLAMVAGGIVQFVLARGPGRGILYRFGRYLGLTAARLDAAAATVKRSGPIGIGLAILTPGIRAATIAACGLAALPMRTFVPGLALGSTLFLSLHFFLGAVIGRLLSALAQAANAPIVLALVAILIVAGLGGWIVIRRRQRPTASRGEIIAEAVEAWHEATCPACLALGAASRIQVTAGAGLESRAS